MGDVVALDPQGGLRQVERLLEFLEGEVAGGEVAGPPHLVQGEGVGGVPGSGLQQRGLVAALGHPQLHPGAPLLGEQLGEQVGAVAGSAGSRTSGGIADSSSA